MKNPFRKRPQAREWPPELERRQPGNGPRREAHEAEHKAMLRAQADQAALQTYFTNEDLMQLEARVNLLRIKAGDL